MKVEARTPLPKSTFYTVKVFVLMTVSFVEAMFNSMLYPFIAYMVQDFLYPQEVPSPDTDKAVSFYAGLVASCFSLAQFISSPIWGRVSDRIGRRTVILTGLLGNILTAPLFGLAPTYTLAVLFRSLSGLINGNLGVAKAYTKEVTDDTNCVRAFSYLGFAWGLGVIIGPLLGGSLSHIAERLPNVFAPGGFWGAHPYLLPMLVLSAVSGVGLVIGWFSIEDAPVLGKRTVKMEVLLRNKEFLLCTSIYAVAGLAFLGFQEVFPFWCKAVPESGGLGIRDESTIGAIQASGGLSVMVFQLLLVPWANNTLGILQVMRISVVLCIPVFFTIPFFSTVQGFWLYAGLVGLYVLFAAIQACLITSIGIAINNSVPSFILGTANGVAQSAVSLFRFIGPVTYGGLFGWSVGNGLSFPFNFHFVFNLTVLLSVLVLILLFLLQPVVNTRKPSEGLFSPLLSPIMDNSQSVVR